MSKILNLEVPDVLAEEIERAAVRGECSVNDIGLRIVDEWARI